jgi:small subunit ribosomal protein S6
MQKYEIMYILRDNLDEEARKAAVAKVHAVLTDNGATITTVTELGLKELAYEIKKEKKGYYVVLKIVAPALAINEFDRLGKINAQLLRHLIIKDPEA